MLQISGRRASFPAEAFPEARNMRHTNDEMPAGNVLIEAAMRRPPYWFDGTAGERAIRLALRHVVDFVVKTWVESL